MSGGRGGRIFGLVLVLAIVGMALISVFAALDGGYRHGFEWMIVALIAEAALVAMLVLGPIGRAIAGLLEGEKPGPDSQLQERILELEERLFYLGNDVQRMQDLEQRLEFTERLLARPHREPGQGD